MSTNRCQHQATQSTSFQQVCASEININFETLTGFTCSAVYDTATSTTLPPVSSPSPVDGGTPTPIVQECTTISVLPQVPTSADATTLPISTPPGRRYGTNFSSDHHCFRRSVQKVQRHLRRAERASSIAHRHWRLRFYFAAHRLRRHRVDETPRTGIGVNNELLQQRTGIGVTAPITPRTGIGLPPRTAGSTIAFPKPVSAYAGLYALSPADLDNDYDSSSDSPDNPHRRRFYTSGVFISVPDNPLGVPDNPRKRDFHRWTYAALGG